MKITKRPPVAFALAVSHRDVDAAMLWLRWASWLSGCADGDVSRVRLLVMLSMRVPAAVRWEIVRLASARPSFFDTTVATCVDELEIGYPGAASHLFCRTIEKRDELWPDHSLMFCEADTVPLRPTWAAEIAEDYASRSAPFVGVHIPSTRDAVERYGMPSIHLTGNAIYPPNALLLAPSIRQCLAARLDNGPWAEKGWAWDLFCAHEIVPESEETGVIQQIWQSDPWTPASLGRLNRAAAIFHQSKDGSLIYCLAHRDYPEFLESLPDARAAFVSEAGHRLIWFGDHSIEMSPVCIIAGRVWTAAMVNSPLDAALMRSRVGRGVVEIPVDEYHQLMSQRSAYRLD